jgi:hypothetical protein
MVFETSAQLCVVDICGETEMEQSGMNEWKNGRCGIPADKDAGFMRYAVTLGVELGRWKYWRDDKR